MRKYIGALIIFILTITTLSFTVYAAFKFPGFVTPGIIVDINDENWDSNKSRYHENDTFTVRFIPQPILADKNTLEPINDDTKGYFENNGHNYKYKDVVVRTNISVEVFMQIGIPKCNKTKDPNNLYNFVGWTYSKDTAITYGYGGNGDLNLMDSKVSLRSLDNNIIDGTEINDGIINLYAVYDQGLNDISLNKDKHSYVNLVSDGKYRSFSKLPLDKITYDKKFDLFVNNKDARFFMTNGLIMSATSNVNLHVRDNNDNELLLNQVIFKDLRRKESLPSEVTNLDLILEDGFYNIYYFDIPSNQAFDDKFFDNIFPTRNIIHRFYGINSNYQSWILVEQVPDFDYLGGYTYSYGIYDHIEPFTYNPFRTLNEESVYTLKNVRLFYKYAGDDPKYKDNEYNFHRNGFNNKFNLSTFTVVPKTTSNIKYKVVPFAPLAKTGGVLKGYVKPLAATSQDYYIDSNVNNTINILNGNVLKATETGTYDIDLDIKPGFNSNGEYELTLQVSIRYKTHDIFILIFENKSDIGLKSNNIDLSKSKKPLYVSAITCNDNYKLPGITNHKPYIQGDRLTDGSKDLIDLSSKQIVKFNNIKSQFKTLYNFENNYIYDFNNTKISGNLILYINNK